MSVENKNRKKAFSDYVRVGDGVDDCDTGGVSYEDRKGDKDE